MSISFVTIKELEEYIKSLEDLGNNYSLSDFTCYNCKSWLECAYSFDPYNIKGDCIMEK